MVIKGDVHYLFGFQRFSSNHFLLDFFVVFTFLESWYKILIITIFFYLSELFGFFKETFCEKLAYGEKNSFFFHSNLWSRKNLHKLIWCVFIFFPDCLQKFVDVEELAESERFYCNSCKSKQRSTKKFWIRRLPNVST